MALTTNNNCASKEKEMFCQFHPLKLAISFKRIFSSLRLRRLEMRFLSGPLSSYFSYHKDRWLSLPTTHLDPHLKTTSPFLIVDQVLEQVQSSRWALVGLLSTLFLWFNTLAHREDISVFNLQLSLAKKAIFLALAAWMPRPPSLLGLVIFFQLTM